MNINNKRKNPFKPIISIESVKTPKIVDVSWLTVDEWISTLGKNFQSLSFPKRIKSLKGSMVEVPQIVKIGDEATVQEGRVIWLDFGEIPIPVYVILESSINESYFDEVETRQNLLGLDERGVDITVYAYAQHDLIFEGRTELRPHLKKSMVKSKRPLISLKWDIQGKVLEIVWLQGCGTIALEGETFEGINGKTLKNIIDLFAELLPPSEKILLSDQAKRSGILIRKYYPLIKSETDYPCGPGYYGSWGFVPSNCWRVKPRIGDPISQSRDLYYFAVDFLRSFPVNDLISRLNKRDAVHLKAVLKKYRFKKNTTLCELFKKGYEAQIDDFQWFLEKILVPTKQIPEFDKALEVIERTELWEKKPDEGYRRGYIVHRVFSDSDKDFKQEDHAYDTLVSQFLDFPEKPQYL